jgi:hypothetical protein
MSLSRSEYEIQENKEKDSADDRPEESPESGRAVSTRRTGINTGLIGDPAADKRADDADNNVADNPEPGVIASDHARNPSGETAKDDPK